MSLFTRSWLVPESCERVYYKMRWRNNWNTARWLQGLQGLFSSENKKKCEMAKKFVQKWNSAFRARKVRFSESVKFSRIGCGSWGITTARQILLPTAFRIGTLQTSLRCSQTVVMALKWQCRPTRATVQCRGRRTFHGNLFFFFFFFLLLLVFLWFVLCDCLFIVGILIVFFWTVCSDGKKVALRSLLLVTGTISRQRSLSQERRALTQSFWSFLLASIDIASRWMASGRSTKANQFLRMLEENSSTWWLPMPWASSWCIIKPQKQILPQVKLEKPNMPFSHCLRKGEYSQEVREPPANSRLKRKGNPNDPPMLPPHLLRALLNTPPMQNPLLLPTPHHVMLNHLYINKGREREGISIFGVTCRVRNKFVTTVLYTNPV